MHPCRVLPFDTQPGLTAPMSWDCRTASSACTDTSMRVSTMSITLSAPFPKCTTEPATADLGIRRGLTSRRLDENPRLAVHSRGIDAVRLRKRIPRTGEENFVVRTSGLHVGDGCLAVSATASRRKPPDSIYLPSVNLTSALLASALSSRLPVLPRWSRAQPGSEQTANSREERLRTPDSIFVRSCMIRFSYFWRSQFLCVFIRSPRMLGESSVVPDPGSWGWNREKTRREKRQLQPGGAALDPVPSHHSSGLCWRFSKPRFAGTSSSGVHWLG
jgi:hypothetical protein